MTTRKVWTYAEAVANAEEFLKLVVNGEPQQIARPDGVNLMLHSEPEAAEKPFVSALDAFKNFPRDCELVIERISEPTRLRPNPGVTYWLIPDVKNQ